MKSLEGLEQYIAAAGEFQLMGGGEPLISPAFWKIMEYIRQHHKSVPRISISSNGAALNKHFAEKLLNSPLQEISFSLDAASPEVYRKIRNADYDKTIENIGYFLRRRREKGQPHPFVMLNMTLMRENIDEFVPFIESAHAMQADAVQFWPLHDYDPSQTANWTVNRNGWTFTYREQMLGQNEEDAAYANAVIDKGIDRARELGVTIIWPVGGRTRIVAQPENVPEIAAGTEAPTETFMPGIINTVPSDRKAVPREDLRECVAPWEWMAVSEAGDVRPCCYIGKPLGNLRESSPEEVWNGPEYREMRTALARGVLPRQCRNAACKYVRSGWIYANGLCPS
jgi:MoaA/NifB/PqqE/SkfB family radical SAM enzyme